MNQIMNPLVFMGTEMTHQTFGDMNNNTLETFKNRDLANYIYHIYPNSAPEIVQSLAKANRMKMSQLVLTEGELKKHADEVTSEMTQRKDRNDKNTMIGYTI